MYNNWCNYDEKLKFSDTKKTRKVSAFFSKQKSSEKSELEVDEQNENRPSSSNMVNMVHDFVVQSESRPLTSTSLAKSQFTHVAESGTWGAIVIDESPTSVRPCINFFLNIFFSETTNQILIKFLRNVPAMDNLRISVLRRFM